MQSLEEAQLEIKAGSLGPTAGIWGIDVDQHKCLMIREHHPAGMWRFSAL